MTVKELIKALKKLPPDLDVMIGDGSHVRKVESTYLEEVFGEVPDYLANEKVALLTNQ